MQASFKQGYSLAFVQANGGKKFAQKKKKAKTVGNMKVISKAISPCRWYEKNFHSL